MISPLVLRNDVQKCLESFLLRFLTPEMRVYDVGCGAQPFKSILSSRVREHIGVDIPDGFYEASHIDLVGSAYNVPAPDGAADAIISSQVLEHLARPDEALKETARLLRTGGLFFLSFPFLYPIHAEPRDYLRYTHFYCEGALNEHGFEILEREAIGGFWYCGGFFLGLYLQYIDRSILKKLRIVRGVTFLLRWMFYLIHRLEGAVLRLAARDATEFRLPWTINYVFVARKR